MLADKNILDELEAHRLKVVPSIQGSVQPASIELHLDTGFIGVPPEKRTVPIDPRVGDLSPQRFVVPTGQTYRMEPGEFLLGSTFEKVGLPNNIAGQLAGKSSLARIGLMIHVTAGFIDPGFEGHITLELTNLGMRPILLRPTMRIAQLCLWYTDTPAQLPYGSPGLGSHYQGQTGAQAGKGV